MSEKSELLEEVDLYFEASNRVDFGYYLYVMLIIISALLLAFPKIYITQQIYLKSRDIAKLQVEYDTLKEENKIIKGSVEAIKFKNQILDTLF